MRWCPVCLIVGDLSPLRVPRANLLTALAALDGFHLATNEDARHTLSCLGPSHSANLTPGARYLLCEATSAKYYDGGSYPRRNRPDVSGRRKMAFTCCTNYNTPLSGMASCARVGFESTSIGQHHTFPKKVSLSVSLSLCLSLSLSLC